MTDRDPELPEPLPDDPVDEAIAESFPASDPPAWEPLRVGTPPPPEPKHAKTSDDTERTDKDGDR